jgi:tripartite-type tricarboxylate transporter receptor subunit TctC
VRSNVYPDLPTVQETGLAGFEVDLWLGIFAPAATPADVIGKLNDAIRTTLKDPEVIKALAKVGVDPRGTTQKEGEAFLLDEFTKWKKVIEDGKIKEQQ